MSNTQQSTSGNTKPETMTLSSPERSLLLTLAWQSIAHGLKTGKPLSINTNQYSPGLIRNCATFVTISYQRHPRGNFGNLRAIRPLAEDVCENAFAAAFCDRHCHAVTDMEINDLHIEIDLLSPLENMQFDSELKLMGQLRPKIDGLTLEDGSHHAFFLPNNWQTFPSPMQFLQQLKRKAGLPATYWSKTIKVHRFTVETSIFSNPR